MEWSGEKDVLKDIDDLSFMTFGTPHSKIKNCKLISPHEPVNDVTAVQEVYTFGSGPKTCPVRGRGALIRKAHGNIDIQASDDCDIEEQLRKHCPYTYSNQFIEGNFGASPSLPTHQLSSENRVPLLVEEEVIGQYDDPESSSDEPKTRSRSALEKLSPNELCRDQSTEGACSEPQLRRGKNLALNSIWRMNKKDAKRSKESEIKEVVEAKKAITVNGNNVDSGCSSVQFKKDSVNKDKPYSVAVESSRNKVFSNSVETVSQNYNSTETHKTNFPSLDEAYKKKRR